MQKTVLLCLGDQCSAVQRKRHPPFGSGQQRHDDQRHGGDHDADRAFFRALPAEKRAGGICREVDRQREEAGADHPQRDTFCSLLSDRVDVGTEPRDVKLWGGVTISWSKALGPEPETTDEAK
ncbi:MAG: hypothetical protein ABI785_07305 [Gemmatimonadales bacterium]